MRNVSGEDKHQAKPPAVNKRLKKVNARCDKNLIAILII